MILSRISSLKRMAMPQSVCNLLGAGISRIGKFIALRMFSAFITRWVELNTASRCPSSIIQRFSILSALFAKPIDKLYTTFYYA